MSGRDLVFVTIVTRDYDHWARTWADTVAEHHPTAEVRIAFADQPIERQRECLGDERLLVVPECASELGLVDFRRLAFQYTPFELTCALKPFVMRWLLQRYDKVIYLDADTAVYRPLVEVPRALETASIVATPHLGQPASTAVEQTIRAAGTLNGGFLAARRGPSATAFLDWWAEKCRHDCCVDPYAGKFVDQSWLDLAVHYFQDFQVLCEPSLNVAYWNLDAREIRRDDATYRVNGQPLGFFHFSGLEPGVAGKLSRFDGRPLAGDLLRLRDAYVRQLESNQLPELDAVGCEYRCYLDGRPIDPVHREAIRGGHAEFADVRDPFDNLSDPTLPDRFEAIRERLILARKHWQLDELQQAADRQQQWIQKQRNRRWDRRVTGAWQKLRALVSGRQVGMDSVARVSPVSREGRAA